MSNNKNKLGPNFCRNCGGSGLLRNTDAESKKVYGDRCDECNGTGIATDPAARRLACLIYLALVGIICAIGIALAT